MAREKRDHPDFFPNGKRKKMVKKEKPAPKENPPSKSASNEGYARFSLLCNELDGNGTPQTRRRYTERRRRLSRWKKRNRRGLYVSPRSRRLRWMMKIWMIAEDDEVDKQPREHEEGKRERRKPRKKMMTSPNDWESILALTWVRILESGRLSHLQRNAAPNSSHLTI